jgi:hypothetical protein
MVRTPGEILAQGRTIDVELEIISGDTAESRKMLRNGTTFTRGGITEPLSFMIDDVERRVNAQLVRRQIPIDEKYKYVNKPTIQWFCPDPRIYGQERSDSTGLPIEGDGLAYPFVYPSPYVTTAGDDGDFTALNDGNETSPPIATITGTLVDVPRMRFVYPDGSVRELTIDITIVSGEQLVIDVLNGTAEVNGVDRSGQLGGAILEQMLLAPGNTVVQFRALSGSPDAQLALDWADAEM